MVLLTSDKLEEHWCSIPPMLKRLNAEMTACSGLMQGGSASLRLSLWSTASALEWAVVTEQEMVRRQGIDVLTRPSGSGVSPCHRM